MNYELSFNRDENVFNITIGNHTLPLTGAETLEEAEFMANYVEATIMGWDTTSLTTVH